MSILCYFGKHKLDGCVCKRCGTVVHDFSLDWKDIHPPCVENEHMECLGGSCMDYCPDYPGPGYRLTIRKCRRCGYTEEEKGEISERRIMF